MFLSPLRHVPNFETEFGRSSTVQLCESFGSEEVVDDNVPGSGSHCASGVVGDFALEAAGAWDEKLVSGYERLVNFWQDSSPQTHRHPFPTWPSSAGHKMHNLFLGRIKRVFTISEKRISRVFQLLVHVFQAVGRVFINNSKKFLKNSRYEPVVLAIHEVGMDFPVLTLKIFCHCKWHRKFLYVISWLVEREAKGLLTIDMRVSNLLLWHELV